MTKLGTVKTIDVSRYKRFALVADTHGMFDSTINASLRDFDYVIHAGDLGGWKILNAANPRLLAVCGNNDVMEKWPDEELAKLRQLPSVLKLKLKGGFLVVTHGHQFPAVATRHQKLRATFPYAKAILYGHSHRAVVDKTSSPWIINPGASGNVRCHGGPSFITLSISGSGWRIRKISI